MNVVVLNLSVLNIFDVGGDATKEMWEQALACAKAGDIDSIPADIQIRNYSALQYIKRDHAKRPDDLQQPPEVYYVWGAAGTGKSHWAREQMKEKCGTYFDKSLDHKWWCGYQGEDAVIFDDIDKSHSKMLYHFKRWLDKYAFSIEVKGGNMYARPKYMYITSNFHLEEIWPDSKDNEPLLRRMKIIHMTGGGTVLGRERLKSDIVMDGYNPTRVAEPEPPSRNLSDSSSLVRNAAPGFVFPTDSFDQGFYDDLLNDEECKNGEECDVIGCKFRHNY
jgi:hypothetical protein